MTAVHITYADGDHAAFQVADKETVLDAAEKADVPVAHNCKGGVCRACQAIDDVTGEPVLLCQTPRPADDANYSVAYTRAAANVRASKRKAKLVAWEHVGGTVYRLQYRLQFPVKFLAGQYVSIAVPAIDGAKKAWRYFSMANSPTEDKTAVFYVKDIPDGKMSAYLARHAAVGDLTTIDAPYGTFFLRETDTPKLFIAGGTGLAPILSMLSALAETKRHAQAGLVFGVTRQEDLFAVDEIKALKARLTNLRVELMMMEPSPTDGVDQGSVIDGLTRLLNGTAAPTFTEAYLCGPPPMIDAVTKTLAEKAPGVVDIYSEIFSPVDA